MSDRPVRGEDVLEEERKEEEEEVGFQSGERETPRKRGDLYHLDDGSCRSWAKAGCGYKPHRQNRWWTAAVVDESVAQR
jgi:hypothetical protein